MDTKQKDSQIMEEWTKENHNKKNILIAGGYKTEGSFLSLIAYASESMKSPQRGRRRENISTFYLFLL